MKHLYGFLLVLLTGNLQAQVIHQLEVDDDEFNPPTLTIDLGDQVHIFWDDSAVNDHTVTQVAQSTWDVNGSLPLAGGYNFGVGTPNPGTDFTITPTGTVWYVCAFHVGTGMKGVINVLGGSSMEEAVAQGHYGLAPTPARNWVTVLTPSGDPYSVRFIDTAGRICQQEALGNTRDLNVSALSEGMYVVEFHDAQGTLLARERTLIVR